jgi:hypothetical protein
MLQSFYKGKDFFARFQYEDAIASFKKVLVINPRHEEARYYLALCYRKTGRSPEDMDIDAILGGAEAAYALGAPDIYSTTHQDGVRSMSRRASFRWEMPPKDRAKVAGYTYGLYPVKSPLLDRLVSALRWSGVWLYPFEKYTPNEILVTGNEVTVNVEDGEWYFLVRAFDLDGRWGRVGAYRLAIGPERSLERRKKIEMTPLENVEQMRDVSGEGRQIRLPKDFKPLETPAATGLAGRGEEGVVSLDDMRGEGRGGTLLGRLGLPLFAVLLLLILLLLVLAMIRRTARPTRMDDLFEIERE